MSQKKPVLKRKDSTGKSPSTQPEVSDRKSKSHDDLDDDVILLPGGMLSPQSKSQDLRDQGIYYVSGEIRPRSFLDIHQDVLVKHLNGPDYYDGDITLIVNSPGGDVPETYMLLDLIENTRFDLATVALGECASAGAMLVAAGTKGKRMIGKNAMIMIHSYSWGAYGTHHDLVASRHAQDALFKGLIDFWVKHSKYKTRALVEQNILQRNDNWFTAEEAVKHGIVDFIGDAPVRKPRNVKKPKSRK